MCTSPDDLHIDLPNSVDLYDKYWLIFEKSKLTNGRNNHIVYSRHIEVSALAHLKAVIGL